MPTVAITDEANEQIESLPVPIGVQVRLILVRLQQWPNVSGAKTLRGDLAAYYRIRTGDYRVQFHATDRTASALLTVTKVGHRDGFYDD